MKLRFVSDAADLSCFPLLAAMITSQNHRSNNVVAFPTVHRRHERIAAEPPRPSSLRSKHRTAVSGAEINARLLILLGICTTSAVIILTAAHMLQAS